MSESSNTSKSPLKILITNAFLANYTGTEVVVRDLALQFKRSGHSPVVFSGELGAAAQELMDAGIEVTSELTQLTVVPDIIHGQHHPQIIEALLQFPSVPAVWVCHDATTNLDEPFYFPRFLRYVAVDDRCRKRIESNPDIPVARIEVIRNAVDLERFRPRAPLPSKPKRALVFSNYASDRTHLPAVRQAAKHAGLELDVLGLRARTAVPNPEAVLPRYDIVFAKARCALEAMAVGNAVVLCDFVGAGPMVTSENFDRLRSMNFGQGVLTNPLRWEHVQAEIEHYDPIDAARVSQRVQSEAGLVSASHRWVELYRTALAEYREAPRDQDRELSEIANYLRRWSYGTRVHWEREQVERLKKVPLFGNKLAAIASRLLRSRKDR